MESIRWQFYPYVAENPHGRSWLETQAMLVSWPTGCATSLISEVELA